MKIQPFVFNFFEENTFIIWDEKTLDAAIIDPGCSNEREEHEIAKFIESKGLKLSHMLNTHMHLDHSIGDNYIQTTYGLPVECNSADEQLAQMLTIQSQMFHLPYRANVNLTIGTNHDDGEQLIIAGSKCLVIHVPGHTPGHLAYYFPAEGVVFSGDVLFRMSIGRTDLPGGDYNTLQSSIADKLFTLPSDTIVLTGHGPSTTIGDEQTRNPYVF